MCNPSNDKEFDYFLINIGRNGPLHKELMPKLNITPTEAKKIICKIIGA